MNDPVYSAEAMLCAALLEAPDEYEGVRWLDPDMFWNTPNRSIYVAIRWVFDHHPRAQVHEVPGLVRQLLVDYDQTAALQRLATISAAYPVVAGLAPAYAHAVFEANQHEELRDAVAEMARITATDAPLDAKANRIDTVWTRVL